MRALAALLIVATLCIYPPCEAGPRETVAVAYAVDQLIQTSTPQLRNDLERNTPQPAADVCRCGCGRTNCTGPCAKAGVAAAMACAPGAARSVLQIDERALTALSHRPATKVGLTIVSPASWRCGACEALRETLKAAGHEYGDGDLSLQWETRDVPGVTKYPYVLNPRGTLYLSPRSDGKHWTIDDLRLHAGLGPQPPSMRGVAAAGSIDVGTLRYRQQVIELLGMIQPAGNDALVKIGDAALRLPRNLQASIDVRPDSMRVSFNGSTKPRVQYGTGWLSVGQNFSSLSLTGDRVTLGLDGFADLSLRLE